MNTPVTGPSPLALRVSGPLACFTRPEMKTERLSYPVITPSAARGVLEAVLWKPAMRWRVERIKLLSPVAFTSFRRNEVSARAGAPSRAVMDTGGEHTPFVVEDRRQQRNTVALRDVDYAIEARIELTDRAGEGDTLAKFISMFQRRLERGQHFHQPYLGCREFPAGVEPVDRTTSDPIDDTRDLGLMLWDLEFIESDKKKGSEKKTMTWRTGDELAEGFARPVFFVARMEKGVIEVPPDAESAERTVREAHIRQAEGGVS